jgi:phosphoadenosine phosphosulfate reductase
VETIFQFSGGKDSLVCLHLLKPRLDDILVVWLNSGSAFPEVIELMDEVRSEVPHFHEIRSDVLADVQQFGIPADVVPIANTMFGGQLTGTGGLKVRSWIECCGRNLWTPMQEFVRQCGATHVIRGQRDSERYKSTVRNGDTVDGITYEFPIEGWSDAQVLEYLMVNGIQIPEYYQYTDTSLGCWNCTAYMDEELGRVRYMKKFHPQKYQNVLKNLWALDSAVTGRMKAVKDAINV